MAALDVLDTLQKVEELDSSDEEENEETHKKLLTSLGVEEKKDPKDSRTQRSEATEDVSIYSLKPASKVKAQDLLKSLKETVNVNLIKKSIKKLEGTRKLSALLPKATADKVERDAAYETSSKKVSRWDHVVARNRKAEHLTFPLKHENLSINTVDDFVQKFKPKTPLEQEIYALLKGNKYEEQSETGLSRAEEEALRSISLEEARARRAELQKHRALLSYHEAKNRRLGKIKSRRHLRIIRKQKEKKSAVEFEELQRKDPEAAAEKLKLAQKTRAEERAVLRHRQGSKWAKNRMLMAKYNEITKVQIQDQKKLHSELVQKNLTKIESSDEEGDDEVEAETNPLVAPTASLPSIYLPKDNPWLRQNERTEKKDEQNNNEWKSNDEQPQIAYTRSEGILGLESVQQEKEEQESSSDESEDELIKELEDIKKRKKVREQLEEESENVKNDTIQEEKIRDFKNALQKLRKESKKAAKEEEEIQSDSEDINHNIEDNEGLDLSMERRNNLQKLDEVLAREEEVTSLSELHRSSKPKNDSAKKKDEPALEYIDPSKVFTMETKTLKSAEPLLIDNNEPDDVTNRITIQEAFADDDVLSEFIADKDKIISDAKPKVKDLTLPGWGEWGGIGLKVSKRKRKKFFVKPKPPPPRKDQHLGPVIINEKRDVHIAQYQVNQIPFPFKSQEEFERSIRQPIGSTWNTPSTVKKLTQPKVTTVMGAMIDPMDEEDAFDNTKPKKRKRVMQQDGHVGFDDVMDTGPKKHFKRKRGNKKHKK